MIVELENRPPPDFHLGNKWRLNIALPEDQKQNVEAWTDSAKWAKRQEDFILPLRVEDGQMGALDEVSKEAERGTRS